MKDILTFAVLLIFIVMSPGIDFALITKRTLTGGKRDGIKIALGITSGVLIHTTAAALGLSLILMKSALAFEVIRYAGAIYLIYMGALSFIKRGKQTTKDDHDLNIVNTKKSAFFKDLFQIP
ncbi:LysE type translocator [Fontibacillus panacisegetis]|uniref:LysE type translocator n=1 Tax=Fontibacillus panacisegetis TaxID=670482 RepID=A0A1G7HRG5_9BACL|nr:LysE type translocator [Fontibacillus panacisegetis]